MTEGTVRLRLDVAYRGDGFHGFAAQPGVETVAGALGDAITKVVGHPVQMVCAGRTDAGVHASGQVVHVDVNAGVGPQEMARSLNRQLGPRIVVRRACTVPATFDARRSARARSYRYLVLEAPVPDPALAGLAWHVDQPLDVRAMAAGADVVLGEHDFRAFCRRPPGTSPDEPILRRVLDARWTVSAARTPAGPALAPMEGRLLAFEIRATSFCHQMVRSLVGTLVDVGRGRRRAADVAWILRGAERGAASRPAPPHGLSLVAVCYDE